jgi:hypothetical protein
MPSNKSSTEMQMKYSGDQLNEGLRKLEELSLGDYHLSVGDMIDSHLSDETKFARLAKAYGRGY